MPKSKTKQPDAPEVKYTDIVCPECGCDFSLPLYKLGYLKSFAGNKLQVTWPLKEGLSDMAIVGCPQCYIVYKIDTDGNTSKVQKSWKKK